VERFDTKSGHWQNAAVRDLTGNIVGEELGPGFARALEESGPAPYGYVKYKAQFDYANQAKMFISTFTDDALKVFINGKPVDEVSKPAKAIAFDLAKYATAGTNTLEIAYEAFGAYNGGEQLGDLKGIEFVRLGSDAQSGSAVASWQVQRYAAPMRGRDVDPDFASATWSPASFLASGAGNPPLPAFTWCQTKFAMPAVEPAWTVPWKLTFDADCDALIYLNGKFVGRYVTIGPQKEFYLTGPYFVPNGENTLSFLLAYTDRPAHLRTLRVSPYEEFSARRTRVEFLW
jgi:hypothetical protein